jgi:Ca2+-binding EF-hand superfamily protein
MSYFFQVFPSAAKLDKATTIKLNDLKFVLNRIGEKMSEEELDDFVKDAYAVRRPKRYRNLEGLWPRS